MLVREIASDISALAGLLCELAYWQIRALGISQGEIRETLTITGGLYACLVLSVAFPEARPPGHSAAAMAFLVPRIEAAGLWIGRQGWAHAMKLGMLLTMICMSVVVLISTLALRSQVHPPNISDPFFQIKEHEDRIDKLERTVGQQGEQVKRLVEYADSVFSLGKWAIVVIVGTFLGLNVTEFHKTLMAGRRERQREANRAAARKAGREADEDEADMAEEG